MAGSLRVETFPAPPILQLGKPPDEEKEGDAQPQSSSPIIRLIGGRDDGEGSSSGPSSPPPAFSLRLHLSRAEAVEDDEGAAIVVEGAEAAAPTLKPQRLRLSLTGVDVEDGVQPIDSFNGAESAALLTPPPTLSSPQALHRLSPHRPPSLPSVPCVRSAGAALESRWQLKVASADVDVKRASFEVTQEGILRTKSFAIGKSGFRRTSDVDEATAAALTLSLTPTAQSTPSHLLPHIPPPADRPHLELSDATVIEMGLLGRGAGGKVLKSIHRPSLTLVALKCIDVSDKGKRAQLLKELKELDADYCPHVVAFYGAYYHDLTCTVKLGLEYMNRGSLQAIVHEHGKLDELALTHVVKQTLQGLLHLHSNRKLHRDIKPGNILANHFGLAKLSDFGILAELNSSMAKCGTFVGTTIYMSPERLTSEAYSYPADVWSLGMSIITMATGAFPLSTEDGYWGLVMHFNTQPPPTLPPSFSPSFRDFIGRCMQKEPAKRWAVRELLQHPWILNGCEAEEALSYWPEGAHMFEPDPSTVRRQREERLERTRRWEEAEERKKARKGLRSKTSIIREDHTGEAKKPAAVAAAAKGTGEVSDDEEGGGRGVRHRRKAAITRFHPVGLLHLQAEAHVQQSRTKGPREQKEASVPDLYGNGGSDEEEEEGEDHLDGLSHTAADRKKADDSSDALRTPLTARSRRALSALPSAVAPSFSSSRPRQLSIVKSNSAEEELHGGDGLPLVVSPHRGSSSLQPLPSVTANPADLSLASPTRSQRHNVKFVNGHIVGGSASSASQLPSLTSHTANLSSSSLAPLSPTAVLRPKGGLTLHLADAALPSRERANTTGSISPAPYSPILAPLSSSQAPLSAGLPAVHRGTPSLHRRSPSVPAASPPAGSSTPPLFSLPPQTPLTPTTSSVDSQRRGLRSRRPSASEAPTLGPSNRAAVRLPALQTTLEDSSTVKDGASTTAPPPSASPVEAADSQRDSSRGVVPVREKGLGGRKMSSISASLALSDLPPITPVHFRSSSAAVMGTFTSPLLPAPLSPRSGRVMALISVGEMEDLRVVVQAMLDRYQEMEAQEREEEQQQQHRTEPSTGRGEAAGRSSLSDVPFLHSPPPLSLSLASLSSSPSNDVSAVGSRLSVVGDVGLSTPSGRCTPPSSTWPSWLPDEVALQEDIDRVADQLGIRRSIIAHTLRKLVHTQPTTQSTTTLVPHTTRTVTPPQPIPLQPTPP